MGASDTGRSALERDLFLKILELSGSGDIASDLATVLEVLVTCLVAERGYIELYESREPSRPSLSIAFRCSNEDKDEIRAVTSRGIVTAALSAGATVHTPFAVLDDRFSALPSVKAQRLEAVLCVPIGAGGGVLYLEGRRNSGPFADLDVRLVENVAKYIWPSLGQVARLNPGPDPTRRIRERLTLDGVVGRSVALARVFEQLEPYAPLDVTMLLTGASGTGKTQLARAIHDNSPRRNAPFVELNCGAIPEGLIESELFGTMPSAFPGARRTVGKVEAAEGGTLFLDEIVEIPFGAQAKLLQLLQSRQYYALASTKLATANVRLIAATNADLPAMVAERRFREDLLYRINVVAIRMPSLAERRDDISLLIDDMLHRIAREHRIATIPASAQLRVNLETRDWPGNVRQLRHMVEAALIRANAEGAPQVEARHLPDAPATSNRAPTFHEATRLYQRELLRRELESNSWNVARVAERLDLTRSHIYNLIHQFGLIREQG